VELLGLLKGKDVLVGVIDVASDKVETPQEVAAVIRRALKYVSVKHFYPCTNCGMAPMSREIAIRKLQALGAGAALVRKALGARKPVTSKARKPGTSRTSRRGGRSRPR